MYQSVKMTKTFLNVVKIIDLKQRRYNDKATYKSLNRLSIIRYNDL